MWLDFGLMTFFYQIHTEKGPKSYVDMNLGMFDKIVVIQVQTKNTQKLVWMDILLYDISETYRFNGDHVFDFLPSNKTTVRKIISEWFISVNFCLSTGFMAW